MIFTEFFQAPLFSYQFQMFNKLIKNPSEKLKSQLFMNLMFAFEKPSSITRCSIRVMLIEHAERPGILWFARKNNRPSRSLWRHYPVRLESIFSTCCGNDCRCADRCTKPLCRPSVQRRTTRPRLSLRHLNLIRLTIDSTHTCI